MSESEQIVSRIITKWNPLGVPSFIGRDEYKTYIPAILVNAYDFESLVIAIEKMLTQSMELPYDPANPDHRRDVERVSHEIMAALSEAEH